MKNLEQKTEKVYRITVGDWIPGYGIWKTYKALKDEEPNITTRHGDLGYLNALYQCGSIGVAGVEIAKSVF